MQSPDAGPQPEHEERRQRGRPRKLTDELQAGIVAAVEAGVPPLVAARATGVEPRTFQLWMARGRQECNRLQIGHRKPQEREAQFLHFFREIDRAIAVAEQDLVVMVRNLAPENYQAALALLKRIAPSRWRESAVDEQAVIQEELERVANKILRAFPPEAANVILEVLADESISTDDPGAEEAERQLQRDQAADSRLRRRRRAKQKASEVQRTNSKPMSPSDGSPP